MTDKQAEAIKLAEMCDYGDPLAHSNAWKIAVCAELRRLHAREAELEAELEQSKASSHQYFLERNSARETVKRYQQELEAIGAGGVESLRKK